MHHRLFVATTILMTVIAAGCVRETVDEDMAAATETTATTATETSGTLSATTTGSTGGSVSVMTPSDKEFVVQASYASMAEVEHSEIAFITSTNNAVKAFAQRMLTDHGRANEELQKIAAVKGLA